MKLASSLGAISDTAAKVGKTSTLVGEDQDALPESMGRWSPAEYSSMVGVSATNSSSMIEDASTIIDLVDGTLGDCSAQELKKTLFELFAPDSKIGYAEISMRPVRK
jgi:hypothetical protein